MGRSLADKLARDGLLAPGFAIPVFIDVCRALARGAQEGRRPPRPQARQHLPLRGRRRQGARLRHEQARQRRVADADRLHARHARVHGARAVHRRAGRAAHGHLRARRHDVRGADRRAPHRRAEPARAPRPAPAPDPHADAPAPAGPAHPRGARSRGHEVPEEAAERATARARPSSSSCSPPSLSTGCPSRIRPGPAAAPCLGQGRGQRRGTANAVRGSRAMPRSPPTIP